MKTPVCTFLGLLIATSALAGETSKKATAYFPVTKNPEQSAGAISEFESVWYSKHLRAMGEPSLFPPKNTVTAYRLLVLPTWGHPISVRAELVGGAYKLTACRLDGQGGYEPGKVAEKHEVTLTKDDTASLTALLNALRMFKRPTKDGHLGMDGDQWILEGVAGGRYHILNLWCAGAEVKERGLEPFIAVCQFLISHSKLTQRPRNRDHDLLPAN